MEARLTLAGAVARERAWWAYDAIGCVGESPPASLVPFDTSVGVHRAEEAADAEAQAQLLEARDAWTEGVCVTDATGATPVKAPVITWRKYRTYRT